MSTKQDVDKSVWRVVQHIKDTVTKNLVEATKNGTVAGVEPAALERLVLLVNKSVDQGYHTSVRQLDEALNTFQVNVPPKSRIKKKQ